MHILLVRHGTREHTQDDSLDQLTNAGRGEICNLGRMLVHRGLRPAFYLTSTHKHAQEKEDVVALVSHEPGLSRLVTRLTSQRVRPFNRGEALCLTATWQEFLEGRGKIEFRCPVTNYEEKEFREKLVSKTTVSTLLAGFTFTALIELVKEGKPLGGMEVVAVILLTAGLALFAAYVYLYDRMAMPAGF
jgi:phosphohistidine phosphatase SixA